MEIALPKCVHFDVSRPSPQRLTRLPLLARTLPGRAAAALGQAAIAAGIITAGGRSPDSRLRKPATATPAAKPQ